MKPIDADDLGIRMFCEVFGKGSDMQKWDGDCWIRYKLFEQMLKKQPTIEQERKIGKWIDLQCSQCGQVDMSKPNFCPNCGAQMIEESFGGYTWKVVVAGNCVSCGKHIDDDNIFLCKDCQGKQSSGKRFDRK